MGLRQLLSRTSLHELATPTKDRKGENDNASFGNIIGNIL